MTLIITTPYFARVAAHSNVALYVIVGGMALLVIGLLGMAVCGFLLHRNSKVAAYRQRLLERIHTACEDDFARGDKDTWMKRYAAFEAVPYDAMNTKWWKSLDSFYPDLWFTEPRR
jgi:hypothetical protein